MKHCNYTHTHTHTAHTHTHTTVLRPFFWDYSGELVPEKNTSSGHYGVRKDKQRQTHWQSRWAPLHPD